MCLSIQDFRCVLTGYCISLKGGCHKFQYLDHKSSWHWDCWKNSFLKKLLQKLQDFFLFFLGLKFYSIGVSPTTKFYSILAPPTTKFYYVLVSPTTKFYSISVFPTTALVAQARLGGYFHRAVVGNTEME